MLRWWKKKWKNKCNRNDCRKYRRIELNVYRRCPCNTHICCMCYLYTPQYTYSCPSCTSRVVPRRFSWNQRRIHAIRLHSCDRVFAWGIANWLIPPSLSSSSSPSSSSSLSFAICDYCLHRDSSVICIRRSHTHMYITSYKQKQFSWTPSRLNSVEENAKKTKNRCTSHHTHSFIHSVTQSIWMLHQWMTMTIMMLLNDDDDS